MKNLLIYWGHAQLRFFSIVVLLLVYYVIYLSKELADKGAPRYEEVVVTQLSLEEPNILESSYVLSYSLFGEHWTVRYADGVAKVADAAAKSNFYKNWSVRLYHDGKVLDKEKIRDLQEKHKNLFLYDVGFLPLYGNISLMNGRAWRFLAVGDRNVKVSCSRDLDSILLKREEDAVREWMNSGKIFHVMRDHPAHGLDVLGGTWCFRNENNYALGEKISKIILQQSKYKKPDYIIPYSDDQDVLIKFVWPLVKSNVLQHDAYLCSTYNGSVPFPSERDEDGHFIGMIGDLPKHKIKKFVCPIKCRPKLHQNWEYC